MPLGREIVLHSRLKYHITGPKTALESLKDGVVWLVILIHLRALPGISPAPVKTAEGVGIGTADKDTRTFAKRKHAVVVLQKHLALYCGPVSLGGILFAAKEGVFRLLRGVVKQSGAVFHPQDPSDGIVYPLHAHLAFVYQLLERRAVIQA